MVAQNAVSSLDVAVLISSQTYAPLTTRGYPTAGFSGRRWEPLAGRRSAALIHV